MADPTTPNMGLTKPVVLGTPGPTYATEINGNADLIDQHTHAPGFGVQVPTAGINLNADLPFNGNNGIGVRSVRLNSQAISPVAPDLRAVYANGNDLWFNDGVGNAIQLTAAGGVNVGSVGSITGMGGTTATVVYSNISKTFTFSQAANTAAKMDTGDIALRDTTVVSGNAATLKVPASLASSYNITMPAALPGSNLPVSMSSAGALSVAQIATAQVANQAITTALIADANVTPAKLTAANLVVAATGSGNASTTSASFSQITNQSLSITLSGIRPVLIGFVSDGTALASFQVSGGSQGVIDVKFSKDGGSTFFAGQTCEVDNTGSTFIRGQWGAGVFNNVQLFSAGTYTISAYYRATGTGGTPTSSANNVKLFAYEL